MQASALTILKLYDTLNKAYVIPSYQRPFAWSPAKATELLDAIHEDAKAGAKLTSIGTFLFCSVPFIGNVHPFGNNAPNSDAPNTIWEVVDGQQRLTVLAIIGFALKTHLSTLTAAGLVYSPILEFEQLYRTSRKSMGKTVPLLIRDEDNFDNGFKSDLSRLLNSFAGNEPFPPSNLGYRLQDTLVQITSWVTQNLTVANFPTFCNYFFKNCQYVQVEADDQDTAFMMFEPLNSTSEPLTAFEVFRSKVIRNVLPVPDFHETFELLDYDNSKRDDVIRRSNHLVFTTAQVVSGERPRIHFVLLKHYLDAHVSSAFTSQFELGAQFMKSVWNTQTYSATWFDEETKNCIRFIKATNHDASLPLLMRYFQTNANQIPAIAKAIVAFFGLWRAAFPTNSLPDIYRNLFTSTSPQNMALDGGTLMTPTALKVYLRVKLETRLGTPATGKSYEDNWKNQQVFLNYVDLKTICRLFVFLDMGASIKSNLVPNDPWTDLDDIEHILPASATHAPPNINHVGNLTFLPPSVNKSIQNIGWTDKQEIYKLLASPVKAIPPPSQFSDGRPLPPVVKQYLADSASPSLGHLQPLTTNVIWGQTQIDLRTTTVLTNVWKILYTTWLH